MQNTKSNETSVLEEQEVELSKESETDNFKTFPIVKVPSEENKTAVDLEAEESLESNETGTIFEEVGPEEKAVSAETPQTGGKPASLPTDNLLVLESKSEGLEIDKVEQAKLEVRETQDELNHTESLRIIEVKDEVITEQILNRFSIVQNECF